MNTILEEIGRIGIVPVVVLDDAEKAVPVAKALRSGGINCAEVTFRTAAAEASIKNITAALPDMLAGAGTVLTTEQADRAVDAGAKFIVTPGYNPEVVEHCIARGIPVVPGCMDTHAIEMALAAGLDTVKFFPAEAAGGLPMMKALAGPYVNLKFMPTGGINADNLKEYLSFRKIVACGGSWMVKPALVREERYDEIARITQEAVRRMLDFEVLRVGIHQKSEEEAVKAAGRFAALFGFQEKVSGGSVFAGSGIEVTGGKAPGACGHIAVGTGSLSRAVYYLGRQGAAFDMDSAEYRDGELKAVYLKEEIGGFAIQLVQK